MSETAHEPKYLSYPIIKQFVFFLKKIQLPWLHGMSLYDLLDFYLGGIIQGEISYRATAIAFSFFMALFPFSVGLKHRIQRFLKIKIETIFIKILKLLV